MVVAPILKIRQMLSSWQCMVLNLFGRSRLLQINLPWNSNGAVIAILQIPTDTVRYQSPLKKIWKLCILRHRFTTLKSIWLLSTTPIRWLAKLMKFHPEEVRTRFPICNRRMRRLGSAITQGWSLNLSDQPGSKGSGRTDTTTKSHPQPGSLRKRWLSSWQGFLVRCICQFIVDTYKSETCSSNI